MKVMNLSNRISHTSIRAVHWARLSAQACLRRPSAVCNVFSDSLGALGVLTSHLWLFSMDHVCKREPRVSELSQYKKTGCKRWNKQGFEGPHQTGVSFLVKCLCDFFLNVKQKWLRMSNVMCFWFYFCWQNLVKKKESVELWGIKSFLVPCVGAIYSLLKDCSISNNICL